MRLCLQSVCDCFLGLLVLLAYKTVTFCLCFGKGKIFLTMIESRIFLDLGEPSFAPMSLKNSFKSSHYGRNISVPHVDKLCFEEYGRMLLHSTRPVRDGTGTQRRSGTSWSKYRTIPKQSYYLDPDPQHCRYQYRYLIKVRNLFVSARPHRAFNVNWTLFLAR